MPRFILRLVFQTKELAIDVVRPPAAVSERDEQHNHEHAFVDSDVGLRCHEAKVEGRRKSKRPLPGFFLEICQRPRLGCRPANRAVGPNPRDADGERFADPFDHTLGDPLRLTICIHPSSNQLVGVQRSGGRVRQGRVQMTALLKLEGPDHCESSTSARDTNLVTTVGEGKIFANEIVCTVAVVVEAVDLRENDQPLEHHRLQPCFREAEIIDAGETGTHSRIRRRRKHRDLRRSPVDQTVRANRIYLQRHVPVDLGNHHPRDAIRIGI